MYVILECLEFLKTFEIRNNIGKYVKFNDRSFMKYLPKNMEHFALEIVLILFGILLTKKYGTLLDF